MKRFVLTLLAFACFGTFVTTIVNAQGDKRIGKIDGKSRQAIKGRFKKVSIAEINGESTVDIDVDAQEIEIGLVDGASRLTIKTTGKVSFTDKIDGRSEVEITTSASGDVSVKKKIDGKCKVKVMLCHDFRVGEKIDGGPETQVGVTYTGISSVPEVNGGSIFNATKK